MCVTADKTAHMGAHAWIYDVKLLNYDSLAEDSGFVSIYE